MRCPTCGYMNPALSLFCRDCLVEIFDPALQDRYERVNVDLLAGTCRDLLGGKVDNATLMELKEKLAVIVRQSLFELEELQGTDAGAAEISTKSNALHRGMTLFLNGLDMLASHHDPPGKHEILEALSLIEAGNHSINDGISIISGELKEEHQSITFFGSAWQNAAGMRTER